MKVLLINRYFCEISAVETLSWKTFQYLKAQGYDVYFFATDKKPYYIEDYEYSKYFPKDRFKTIEYIKNPMSYYWDFDAAKKLEKFLKDIKPDIAHINQPITLSIIKVLKKYNIPIVWTLHDPSLVCPASTLKMGNGEICTEFYCKGNKYINCLYHKCQNGKLEPSVRKTIRSYFNNSVKLYKEVDLYITPSNALRNLILESGIGISEDKLLTLNNFIDLDTKDFKKIINKQSYFLFVGRIVEEKGIHFLLNAIKELPREIPFVIAGTGSLDNYVTNFIKNNNLNNIKFLGYIKQEEINNLYKNAIATIVPSNFFEIFGMINIESFINKTPVIGSNIAAIPEIIGDGKNGFIFEVGNIEKLKEHILTYWNNLEMAIEHGENGYQKTIENYMIDTYMNNLVEIYKNLINEVSQ